MRNFRIAALTLLCMCMINSYAQQKQVRSGNKLYEEKKFDEASKEYQKALTKNPTYVPGMFNLGNALFQQKNYDASRQVMAATEKQAKDKNVKAGANYNIGNTYMQEQKWSEAAEAYKQSLRVNPNDEDAKYNLSYALAMMKKQEGGGGKNDKNKDDKKDQQDKDKQDQNKDKQDKQDQKDQQNKDQQNQDQQKEEQKDEQDQKKQPQPSKLSEQQADQLLNALAQEEKNLHDKKEKGKAVKIKVDKDW